MGNLEGSVESHGSVEDHRVEKEVGEPISENICHQSANKRRLFQKQSIRELLETLDFHGLTHQWISMGVLTMDFCGWPNKLFRGPWNSMRWQLSSPWLSPHCTAVIKITQSFKEG